MALIGVGWIINVQIIFLIIEILVILSFIIGAFLEPKPEVGFVGFINPYDDNTTTILNNIPSTVSGGTITEQLSHFFTFFAVFFPAVTDILAGANISGDLKVFAVIVVILESE